MKRALKALSIFLSVLILFCGCSTLYENNDLRGIPELKQYQDDLSYGNRMITADLYFYREGSEELVGESREILLQGDEAEGLAIVENLLIGPFEEGLRNAAQATVTDVELMDDVANVYLKSLVIFDDEQKYMLASQIADTVIDFFRIEFVCVFFDGEPLNIDGYPIGALSKSNRFPMDYYDRLRESYYLSKSIPVNIDLYSVIYFIDSTEKYFIPETRLITISGQFENSVEFNRDLIKQMISEIASGPDTKYYLLTYIYSDYLSDEKYGVEYDGNSVTVSKSDGIFFFRCDAERAAFYYTLCGTVPITGDIKIYQENSTQEFSVNRADASEFAGNIITLYIPKSDSSGLQAVKRIVRRKSTYEIGTYLSSLFAELNDTGYFDGVIDFKYSYVNSIEVSGDIVVIDFTQEFIDDFKHIDEAMQKLVMYSIINTMDNLFWTKYTLIRVNGEPPEEICSNMDFEYPLMANYGLLK